MVLVCGLLVTGFAWRLSAEAVEKRAEERFRFQAVELIHAIDSRIRVYEQVLWGGVGLFQAFDNVERKEWKTYVEALRLSENWPGVQGLGWSVPVRPEEKESFENSIRQEGFPKFEITPAGVRDSYTAIVFLEPFDWRNKRAFGYDMWSNETRREAMQRAAASGKASTSGVITLVQETEEDTQKGFLTYVPVYVEGSKATGKSIKGWVYAAFRVGDLMKGVQGAVDNVEFKIFDGHAAEESNLLFASPGDHSSGGLTHQEILNLQGRDWLIVLTAHPNSRGLAESKIPAIVAIMGLIIDGLLFYLIATLVSTQQRAEGLAQRMTVDLRTTNEKLIESKTELERFATLASHDLQEPLRGITSFSHLLEAEFGPTLDAEGKLYLKGLMTSAERMRELIKGLRDYTEFNGIELTKSPVDTRDLVDEVLKELGEESSAKGVEIVVGDLPRAMAGRSLKTVFHHLIRNAVIYRDKGGSVTISGESTDDGTCLFCVTDDGLGVEPQFHDRIFELFGRLHRWEEFPGAGLGLALCRRILKIYDGKIWYEPNQPRGSRFCFTLSSTGESE